MPKASIDILTSPTLKNLRERWWNDEFTEFLVERLRPRPGNRILDVGCGEGIGEVSIGRLQLSQIRMVGIDLVLRKVIEARRETTSHNQRVGFAAGDAVRLPFRDGVFDSTYCVAVLQHLVDVDAAVAEFARVTREHGRIVGVEPDNASRYAYSCVPSGSFVFAAAAELFAAITVERAQTPVGPRLAELFARHGIEPMEVRLFPVSLTFLGAPGPDVWRVRRNAIEQLVDARLSATVRGLAEQYLQLLDVYEADARAAGEGFVEIQNTTLFATVGQKRET
jgi:ubiquinone/menaquinone biosynthesis C-methylase UbiE